MSIPRIAKALQKMAAKLVSLTPEDFEDRMEQGDILWQFNYNRDRYEKARKQSYGGLRRFEHEGLRIDQHTGMISTPKRKTPYALGTAAPKATRVASLPDIRKLNSQLGRRVNMLDFDGSLSVILAKEVDGVFEKEGFYLDVLSWPTWLISKRAGKTYPVRVLHKGGRPTEMELMLRWSGPHSDSTYNVRAMVRHT